MTDTRSTDDLIGINDAFSDEYDDRAEGTVALATEDDRTEQIMIILRSLTMQVEGLSLTLSRVETQSTAMHKGKNRDMARLPNMDALKIADSRVFRVPNTKTESLAGGEST